MSALQEIELKLKSQEIIKSSDSISVTPASNLSIADTSSINPC